MKNRNLHKAKKAKKAKNDEFYTRIEDISAEVIHYKRFFNWKVVYCNCDGNASKFVKYFDDNHRELILKGLLWSDNDFRSYESIEFLRRADIVVTNPPFSMFREYVAQLLEHDKMFLIIGSINAVKYNILFPFIRDNRIRLGYNMVTKFKTPSGERHVASYWYTNLPHDKRSKELVLTKTYNPKDYSKYDNYNAIEVKRVDLIPKDYDGVMGLPITYFAKHDPALFDIVGMSKMDFHGGVWNGRGYKHYKDKRPDGTLTGEVGRRHTPVLLGVKEGKNYLENAEGRKVHRLYDRVFIKRK